MNKMNGWIIFGLILVFIGNIGGLLIIVFQSRSAVQNKDQIVSVSIDNQRILELELHEIKNERIQLRNELEERDKENKELSKRIIELNRELFNKTDEFNKFMGASGAYPLVLVSSGITNQGRSGFTFTLKNESKYPIYDIVVVIMDFDEILNNSKQENGKYVIERKKFGESIVCRKEEGHLAEFSDIISSELYSYTNNVLYIKIKSRSSFVIEKMAFVTVKDTVYHGFQIKDTEGKVLKEWLGENTPNDIKAKLKEKFDQIPENVEMRFVN